MSLQMLVVIKILSAADLAFNELKTLIAIRCSHLKVSSENVVLEI